MGGTLLREREDPTVSFRPQTVLVVDDELDLQEVIAETLREHGYRVVAAKDGQEALDYLIAHPLPSLVVLDLQLPVMSGWDLLGILRSYARFAHLPVLIMSAGESLATVAHPHRLKKPFGAERLLEAVDALARKP